LEWTFAVGREGTHLHTQVQNMEQDGIVGINIFMGSFDILATASKALGISDI